MPAALPTLRTLVKAPSPPPRAPQLSDDFEIRSLIPVDLQRWRGPKTPFFCDAFDDPWLIDNQGTENVSHVLNQYLSHPRVTCCTCLGGLGLWVEGQRWNDGGIDEWHMTLSWFFALRRLIVDQPAPTEGVQVNCWEQSLLQIHRRGDRLLIWDADDPELSWPLELNLRSFVEKTIRAANDLLAFWQAMETETTRLADSLGLPHDWTLEPAGPSSLDEPMSIRSKLATVWSLIPKRESYLDDIEALSAWVTSGDLGPA